MTKRAQAESRDLNRNGRLDVYEDPTAPFDQRVDDLLSQMTLEEKTGQMFYPVAFVDPAFPIAPHDDPRALIQDNHLTHITAFGGKQPQQIAEWTNHLQQLAASTRLGIPVTVATDARHAVTEPGNLMNTTGFSKWPESTGLAATRDTGLVARWVAAPDHEHGHLRQPG